MMRHSPVMVILAGVGLLVGTRAANAGDISLKPSGAADQSMAVQKALDRCAAAGGGTVILAYAGKGREGDPPLIGLLPSSTLKGVTVYYPEQTLPGVLPYPWTVRGEGAHCTVEDVTLVNCYKGIDFGTRTASIWRGASTAAR